MKIVVQCLTKAINHQLDMAVIYEHSCGWGIQSGFAEEDLFVGTQDCRGKALMLMLLRK